MANVQAKGMSMGFGVLASICNGVAFTARQGHHVANGLRCVADGIDNVSTKVDTSMLQKAMEYQLKKQAMAEVANMSDEKIAQCAEAMEAEQAKAEQCQAIDSAIKGNKPETVQPAVTAEPASPVQSKESPMKKAVNSKIATIEDDSIPFAGNFVGEAVV